MKLLYCVNCGDIFNLTYGEKECSCGLVRGRYINHLDAEFSGVTGIPLGFANSSFTDAVLRQPVDGSGRVFEAFVIPKQCKTFVEVEELRWSEEKLALAAFEKARLEDELGEIFAD